MPPLALLLLLLNPPNATPSFSVTCPGRTSSPSTKASGGSHEASLGLFFSWTCTANSLTCRVTICSLAPSRPPPLHFHIVLQAAPLALRLSSDDKVSICTSSGDLVLVDLSGREAHFYPISDGAQTCACLSESTAWFGTSSGRVVVASSFGHKQKKPIISDLVPSTIITRIFKSWTPSCVVSAIAIAQQDRALAIYGDGTARLWSTTDCLGQVALPIPSAFSDITLSPLPDSFVAQIHVQGSLPFCVLITMTTTTTPQLDVQPLVEQQPLLKSFHSRGACQLGQHTCTAWWSDSKVCGALLSSDGSQALVEAPSSDRLENEARHILSLSSLGPSQGLMVRLCGLFIVLDDPWPLPSGLATDVLALAPEFSLGDDDDDILALAKRHIISLAPQAAITALLSAQQQHTDTLVQTALRALETTCSRFPPPRGGSSRTLALPLAALHSPLLATAFEALLASQAAILMRQVLGLLVLIQATCLSPPTLSRAASLARTVYSRARAVLAACEHQLVRVWAETQLSIIHADKVDFFQQASMHGLGLFCSAGPEWLVKTKQPGAYLVTRELVEDPVVRAQGLLMESTAAPPSSAERNALIKSACKTLVANAPLDDAGRADYFAHCARFCAAAQDLSSTLVFAQNAIALSPDLAESVIFAALDAAATDPDPDYVRALAVFREPHHVQQLVMAMVGRGHFGALLSLSLKPGLQRDAVERTLDEIARSGDGQDEDRARVLCVVAFHCKHLRYEQAAEAAYRLAQRAKSFASKADALAVCLNMLRLVPDGLGLALEAPGKHASERKSVIQTVTLQDVELEHLASSAVQVLGDAFASLSPSELVERLMVKPGCFTLALRLCRLARLQYPHYHQELEKLQYLDCQVLENCARFCAAGVEPWDTLESLLQNQSSVMAADCVRVVLEEGRGDIPEWLLAKFESGVDAVLLARVYLKRGFLFEAATWVLKAVPGTDNLAEVRQLQDAPRLPVELLDVVLAQGSQVLASWEGRSSMWHVQNKYELQGALDALEAKVRAFLQALTKIEPGRAAMLKNM